MEEQIEHEVETEFGGKAKVLSIIGKGKQSTVYCVQYNSMKMALKWYNADKVKNLDRIHENIKKNIKDGEPSNKFLWPKYMTRVDRKTGTFGYFMEMKPDSFEYFVDIMNGYKFVTDAGTGRPVKKKVRFASLYAMITAVINIVNSFRQLSRAGKGFQGLSEGSFFINTDTGAVLVSDCDTIAPHSTDLGVRIRSVYKAPEVLLGGLPDSDSDKYSLAIILFRLLFRGDPFEGEKTVMDVCFNEKELSRHYSSEAVFIYDPDDDSNRALRGIHDNVLKFWNDYPDYIKEAFIRSFTVGIKNPEKRLSFDEWQNIFIRLRSEILSCICGKSHFVSMLAKPEDEVFTCPSCKLKYATMKFTNRLYRMPLYIGCKIFECEIDQDSDDFLSVVGVLVENKLQRGLMGIKNCSGQKWRVRMPDGMVHDVTSGKGFPVWQGLEIDFGKVKANL
ncbi:MAG: protein kinase [Ruminococcus flavefaciens]|nr:protein kinase [Ruminococcus flavefaciens]